MIQFIGVTMSKLIYGRNQQIKFYNEEEKKEYN